MKMLILGAGGVGGYFGAQLMRVGADVTFLVRPGRQARIAAEGLRIETPRGNFTVQPPLVTAQTVKPDYDLIVLAPKAYDLDDALASVAGAADRGRLLPVLNGFDHLSVLDQRFGRARVMGGVAHIAATLTPEGAVRQLTAMHSLTVGARHPDQEAALNHLDSLGQRAEFDYFRAADIEQTLWDKWVFLATLAAMTTACRGSVGEILAIPGGEALIREVYGECSAVAAAAGHPISAEAAAKAAGMLCQPGSPLTASLLRDLLQGQKTEHEHILGAMARRGVAAGLPLPLIRLAYTHMAVETAQARPAP